MKVTAFVALFMLTGCADFTQGSYELGSGDANYDALKDATQTCEAQGGKVRLKGGYDGRQLSSYDCVGGKAK